MSRRRDTLNIYGRICLVKQFPHDLGDHTNVCVSPRGNEILVFGSGSHQILRFSLDGGLIGSFGIPNATTCLTHTHTGICPLESNILVRDVNNRGIQIFNENYNPISFISTGSCYPTCVCTSKRGDIIVGTVENIILIFNTKGHYINQFSVFEDHTGTKCIIRAIACNSRDEILIAHPCHQQVQIYSRDGVSLRTFASISLACAICVDQENNILILDKAEKKINIFDSDETYVTQIRLSTQPYGICIHNRRIIVTDENCINIFSNW